MTLSLVSDLNFQPQICPIQSSSISLLVFFDNNFSYKPNDTTIVLNSTERPNPIATTSRETPAFN